MMPERPQPFTPSGDLFMKSNLQNVGQYKPFEVFGQTKG